MITTVNITKILNFKYNPNHLSGMINGEKWYLYSKNKIIDEPEYEIYEFVFLITKYDTLGKSITRKCAVNCEDEDIEELAETVINNDYFIIQGR